MSSPDFLLTNLELRASKPDGSEGAGLSHQTGGIGGAGMVLVRVLELGPPPSKGVPDGAAIVVHDAGDHGAHYEKLADKLAAAGWMVSLPDLRGHGMSEGERGHTTGIPEPVRDIHSVREHVAYRIPDIKSVVIGIGSGALWAMAYALKHQDEVHALVLATPLMKSNFGAPQKVGGVMGLFKKVTPLSPCVIPWRASDMLTQPGDMGLWNADPKRDNTVTKGTVDAIEKAIAEVPAKYAALGMPTLVLAGSDDPICTPADAAAFAEQLGAKYAVVEDARHSLFHGPTSQAAIDLVVDWLRTL